MAQPVTALRVLDDPQLHHPAPRVRRALLFKVREIYAARAYAALAARARQRQSYEKRSVRSRRLISGPNFAASRARR